MWLDYLIIAAYLVGTSALGYWLGRKQKDIQDFFLAGRNVPWWAISLSIVATETSTLTFIGAPALAYATDLKFLQLVVGYFVGRVVVSFLLIPSYFRGEIHTAYQLLRGRFGPRAKNLSSLLFMITRALADGVRLFATGLVLRALNPNLGDLWSVVIMGAVTIFYTLKGGMIAVVWTDIVQLVIYLAGAALAAYEIIQKVPGGWSEISGLASVDGKFAFLDFSWNPGFTYTFWSGVIGGAFLTTATHGTDQLMVQRYLSCNSRRGSQVALIVSGAIIFAQFALFLLIGTMLYAFYHHFPLAEPLQKTDEIFPRFIVSELPRGLSGVIIAAIFAAAMSTLSGSLNSLASTSVNDFYRPYFRPEAGPKHYLRVSRLFTFCWGVVLIGVAFLARHWGSVLEVGLTIASFTFGSILGVFLLAVLTRRAHELAAIAGMVAGLFVMLAVHLHAQIAWTWYVTIGAVTTFSVGMLMSWIWPNSPSPLGSKT